MNAVRDDDDGDSDGDLDGETDASRTLDLDTGDSDDVAAGPGVRVREGLPPSYRMRHEPHYVEALVGRSAPPPVAVVEAAPQPPPGRSVSPVPAPNHAPELSSGGGGARLQTPFSVAAESLAGAFDAIQAALRDLPTTGRPLRDRVAVELARAEATRGRWLAEAAVVMQREPIPALDEVDLVGVLRTVFEALGPESRLSGGAAAMPLPDGVCRVFGDERLLTTAVGAALAAMRAVIDDRGDARKLSVTVAPRRDDTIRTIAITQWALRLPVAAYERFFDCEWGDHPAGPSGALLLAAARRIAVAHGGGLELGPMNGGGCCLMLSLPAAT